VVAFFQATLPVSLVLAARRSARVRHQLLC
jgi:hypothetical protein